MSEQKEQANKLTQSIKESQAKNEQATAQRDSAQAEQQAEIIRAQELAQAEYDKHLQEQI